MQTPQTTYTVPHERLIQGLKERLKEFDTIKPPEWAKFAKTGVHRQRPPLDPEWWYVRAGSLLRKIYTQGPVGISRLRKKYGGRKRGRRVSPPHFAKGSGNILRKQAQQLEKAGLITVLPGKGRVITPKGHKFIEEVARSCNNIS